MDLLKQIYGQNADIEKCRQRISNLRNTFFNYFKTNDSDVFSSSGRIEILGNHTDHNNGCVVVGAIDQDILAVCKKENDGTIFIKSKGYEDIKINANDFHYNESEKGKSIALIKGVLKGLKDRGLNIGGFSAALDSNVFKGAGVSSSAAYEVLFCKILSYYYCNDCLTPLTIAQIAQFAEREYFGKPCGLLDQTGIAFGGINYIDFENTKTPEISTINTNFNGYNIVITNCGSDHSDLTHEYAAVKNDMQAVSAYFGKDFLRQVPFSLFYSSLAELYKKLGGRAILRAIHFYEENLRADLTANALRNNDMASFLKCVNQSGESSYKLLQNCYAQGDSLQGIPLAIELSKQILKCDGAVRVHGGGFAGTIIAFVPCAKLSEYTKSIQSVFGNENVICTNIRNIGVTKLN